MLTHLPPELKKRYFLHLCLLFILFQALFFFIVRDRVSSIVVYILAFITFSCSIYSALIAIRLIFGTFYSLENNVAILKLADPIFAMSFRETERLIVEIQTRQELELQINRYVEEYSDDLQQKNLPQLIFQFLLKRVFYCLFLSILGFSFVSIYMECGLGDDLISALDSKNSSIFDLITESIFLNVFIFLGELTYDTSSSVYQLITLLETVVALTYFLLLVQLIFNIVSHVSSTFEREAINMELEFHLRRLNDGQ